MTRPGHHFQGPFQARAKKIWPKLIPTGCLKNKHMLQGIAYSNYTYRFPNIVLKLLNTRMVIFTKMVKMTCKNRSFYFKYLEIGQNSSIDNLKADNPQKVMAEKCISQNIRLPAKNLNFYSTEKFELMAAGSLIFWEIGLSAITF